MKDLCTQGCCERSLKTIGVPTIWFITSDTQYDVEGSKNEFTIYLYLNDQTSTYKKKRKIEEGPDNQEVERTYNKSHQKVCKLCKGSVEAYIHWTKQLNTVINGKPCDTILPVDN